MNPTDEFILDAFKQQEILSEEVLNEIIRGRSRVRLRLEIKI